MNFQTRTQKLKQLVAGVDSARGKVPASSLKSIRGAMSQRQLALKSGVAQPLISQIEAGDRSLTSDMAMRLAPALNVTGTELWIAERISQLNQVAQKEQLDVHSVLELVLQLAQAMPDSDVGEQLTEALLGVAKDAIELAEDQAMTPREGQPPEATLYSAKGQKPRPDRDSSGRRINKPHEPRS